MIWNLDSVEHFGNVKKALTWGLEADGMAVWQESLIKSIFAVSQMLFFCDNCLSYNISYLL